jgi:RHS repeat-associated protein
MVVNVVTGAVEQKMRHDAWGRVEEDTAPGFQPFGYAGGLHEPMTGTVRFGAREYDAVTGRWMQKDPIRFAGGDSNLYAYVGGDPVNFIDTSGTVPWAVLGVGAFAVLSPFLVQSSDDVDGLFKAALPLGQPASKSIPWMGEFIGISMAANAYGENSFPSASTNSEVQICRSAADLPMGEVSQWFGVDHTWLKTVSGSRGMGSDPNDPERPWKTSVVDHSDRVGTCTPVQTNASSECLDRQFSIGKSLGIWGHRNNCRTSIMDAIQSCEK